MVETQAEVDVVKLPPVCPKMVTIYKRKPSGEDKFASSGECDGGREQTVTLTSGDQLTQSIFMEQFLKGRGGKMAQDAEEEDSLQKFHVSHSGKV